MLRQWFNLMQLIVLLIALTQTMIVHRLDHRKMSDLLIFFDKVSRVIIPVMLYPSSVIGMVLLGLHFRVLGWTVLLGGYGGSFLLGIFWVKQVYLKARVERKKVIKEVQNVKEEDCDEPEEYLKLLAKWHVKIKSGKATMQDRPQPLALGKVAFQTACGNGCGTCEERHRHFSTPQRAQADATSTWNSWRDYSRIAPTRSWWA